MVLFYCFIYFKCWTFRFFILKALWWFSNIWSVIGVYLHVCLRNSWWWWWRNKYWKHYCLSTFFLNTLCAWYVFNISPSCVDLTFLLLRYLFIIYFRVSLWILYWYKQFLLFLNATSTGDFVQISPSCLQFGSLIIYLFLRT